MWLEILAWPFQPILLFPWLALGIGIVFLVPWFRFRAPGASRGARAGLLVAALAWLAYGLYEIGIQEAMRDAIAPIRIDLLVIVPGLYAVTALGVGSWVACARRG